MSDTNTSKPSFFANTAAPAPLSAAPSITILFIVSFLSFSSLFFFISGFPDFPGFPESPDFRDLLDYPESPDLPDLQCYYSQSRKDDGHDPEADGDFRLMERTMRPF